MRGKDFWVFLSLKTHRNACYAGHFYSNDDHFLHGYLTAGETYHTDVLKCLGATFDLRQYLRELLKSQS